MESTKRQLKKRILAKEKKDDDDDFKRRSTNFKASMCQKRLRLFLAILCGSFKANFPQIGVPKD